MRNMCGWACSSVGDPAGAPSTATALEGAVGVVGSGERGNSGASSAIWVDIDETRESGPTSLKGRISGLKAGLRSGLAPMPLSKTVRCTYSILLMLGFRRSGLTRSSTVLLLRPVCTSAAATSSRFLRPPSVALSIATSANLMSESTLPPPGWPCCPKAWLDT